MNLIQNVKLNLLLNIIHNKLVWIWTVIIKTKQINQEAIGINTYINN